MEILKKFKENGYYTAELYHLLEKKEMVDVLEEIIPSVYEKEMRMSTTERLQHLNNIIIDNIVKIGKKTEQVVLSFSPRILVFQNYKPGDRIVAKFTVKNISTAPTYLNMVHKESSVFSLNVCGGQMLSRLAPGISVTFAVTFTPLQYEDYAHRITYNTGKDNYILPLIGMGPRPIFSLPDTITIPKTPLKVENFTMVTVRNIGVIAAGCKFNVRNPFSVHPKSIYLASGEKIEIRVGYQTMRPGQTYGSLNAIFETGENFWIKLTGSTYAVSIELEKQVVRFDDTYNTMIRQQTYKIFNKSDQLLTYMCMKHENIYSDFEEKLKLATKYYEAKDNEAAKYRKLEYYDVLNSEEHGRAYTRIFYDEIQDLVADESLNFQNTHFSITPIRGQLWPNKATELTISFHPKEPGEFDSLAYFDIDGVYERLPIKMVGTSMPPSIHLTVETLNMENVYINKRYCYEVTAVNKGHINGVIVYKEAPALFDSHISCTPEMHCLRPGEEQMFVISFCNSNQGPYFEEINFALRDTNVVLKLYLKGTVIYPSLMFSIPCLDFGNVSLGRPETLSFEVINESIVNVDAILKIVSDGPEISSFLLSDYTHTDIPKPEVPQWPKEFTIVPSKIELGPESRMSIEVTFVANKIRRFQTNLELELKDSDSPPIILPISINAVVPKITPAPDIKLRSCFLDYAYKCEIILQSDNSWGYFSLEQPQEPSTLDVDIAVKEGWIEPNSAIILPTTIRTSVLGKQEYCVRLRLFGLSEPIEVCNITGFGVRPIVTCSPLALHWGQVKLLTRANKTVVLCNDSPVTVNFSAYLLNKDGRWQISPAEGSIAPEGEIELVLSLYLIDADSYTNKAVIQLEKVKDIYVPLSATGVGTSIVIGEYRDRMVLGRNFTRIPLNCKVIMENCGTRLHALEWSEHYKAPKTKEIVTGFFNVEPRSFKMGAGEKVELTVTGISNKVMTVKEMWYLIGSVEGINKKELLMECEIMAEFVDPKIVMSSTDIDFRYDYGPYSEYYKLTDIVTIKNVSRLPLEIDINVKPPFVIIEKCNTYKVDILEQDNCCCICYNESDMNMANIQSEMDPYQSRTFIDCMTLKPVELLRPGPLHFFQDIHKIKMAFRLTNSVQEVLEDQDVMKIQILFDTTKHTSLKSKMYCDLLRVRFKGHRNRDAIKLVGRINFPNIFVLTPRLDFHCILNGSVQSRIIEIQNVSPVLACYTFQWKKCSVSTLNLPDITLQENLSSLTDPTKTSTEMETAASVSDISDILAQSTTGHEKQGEPHDDHSSLQPKVSIYQGPEPTENGSIASSLTLEEIKVMVLNRMTPMVEPKYGTKFDWSYKFSKAKSKKYDLNDMLQIIPHRGLLKPHELQSVHVIFRPQLNISIRAILECDVLGGPTETILVSCMSCDLMYRLSAQKINFKIRSFHENAFENLIITNIAQLSFEYKTYTNEPKFKNELPGTILELSPSEKTVEPEEEAVLKIVMRPGVIGYFHREFLLQIGYLNHLTIEVFGWGVIPQVYLSLKRPDMARLCVENGYKAIAALTNEYLHAVNEIFGKASSEHLNSPLTDKYREDPDLRKEWHIVTIADAYPTIMDIELAIERMEVIKYIKHKPDILTLYSATSKSGPIPGFATIPYVVDFGVVITGSVVQCVADVVNYGPISVRLHFTKGTCLPKWLSVKLCGKVNPGEVGKLEITFSPTSLDFDELEQTVETHFNLEVPYGVVIPIHIKALCAVPYLTSNVAAIDFGSVRCGDKVICSVPLKNVGKPTCVWYVTLKLKAPGRQPMMVLNSSGVFEPGVGDWLSVAFKPTMEMLYEGYLVFRFHMNPNRLVIPVKGKGIFPHVHIIGPNVLFPPTLPWSDTVSIYFGLTNPCPFPIELIIAHSDTKWKEEEEIYQLLYRYYNKPDEMLLPALKPGAGMPDKIVDFYKTTMTNVRKTLEEEIAIANKLTARSTPVPRKAKSPKPTVKSAAATKEASPRVFRTENEIIADQLKTMKANDVDPLNECLNVTDQSSGHEEYDKTTKGQIIIFHGSPCEEMQGQEIAYALGKRLDLPTINVDLAIVHALCVADCPARSLLLNTITDLYSYSHAAANRTQSDDVIQTDEEWEENEDEFGIIHRKLLFISSNRMNTPRSKISDKKKRKSASTVVSHSALGTNTMFNLDLLHDLLSVYLNRPEFKRGFIVDCLTSFVLKSPNVVLTTVLKCKPTIHNLHLVLCHGEFNRWAQAYEEALREQEAFDELTTKVYTEQEIEEIVVSVEDMDDEEFEKAAPEFKALYVTHALENRRRKFLEKKMARASTYHIRKEKIKDRSKSLIGLDLGETKKKVKKDDTKAKPTSDYLIMQTRYHEYYKTIHESLIHFANNWNIEEGELAMPLLNFMGQVVGATPKGKKKKSEMHIQISEEHLIERGFPLTFVPAPCLMYKEAVVNMFVNNPIVGEALKVEKESDILKHPVQRKEFTVLLPKTFPTIQHEEPLRWRYLDEQLIKKCECNQLTDLNLLDDTTQDNVLNILSKWHCTCGKKISSNQTSTTEIPSMSYEKNDTESDPEHFYPSPLPLNRVRSLSAHASRLVLEPGDLVRCKYSFNPQVEGNFTVKRYVEVAGWPDSRVEINVTGICDLPRLDSRPKKMFGNFIRRTIENVVHKITYLDDRKVFEFGPIFIGSNRVYEEEYPIDLKNCSLIPANVLIEFLEDTNVFNRDKSHISLEPGCRDKVTIYAAPPVVGVHTADLLFCVKDNPEVITVNIACSGVVPIVEILPTSKYIDYGKHLLYRRENDRFIIKNDSILPIMWKIRNADEFLEDFIISQTSGIVPRHDNQVVPVTYIACRVGIISHKQLIVDIYDAGGRGDPMLTDVLSLSAECYDVMIECAYENPQENFLNYGNVKVNSTVYRELYLLNRGKYNIYYKLKKVKDFPEPSLLKSFTVSAESGIIPATVKLVVIEFDCTPTTSVNLTNVPIYTCSLLDGSKDQVVVARFPVCATIASFYNTFTLFPLGELNFHIIAVGSSVLREVILNNTSKCPFNYDIVVPKCYRVDPNLPPPVTKGKDNKLKNPPLKCGNFLILNEDNLLAPGTSRTIQIQFFASAARTFEETIKFIISDTCPAEAQGVPLKLVGTGAMPTLDIWNLETTFREHLIVRNLSEYKVHETSPHCVFVEDSVTFHFFCVNVNSKFVGAIDLYNNGLVPCALTMNLQYQTNTNSNIFSLDKYNTHIEPLMHRVLGVIFTPKALEEYRAVLEIKLKLLDNQDQTFKICLIGEGCIPRIQLLSPAVRTHKLALRRFPVTCLGSITTREIRFKNISSVKSIVKVAIKQNSNEDRQIFWLTTSPESEHMILKGSNELPNEKLVLLVQPAEVAKLIVHFNPLKKGRITCDIKLSVKENPFEYYTVLCEAEAFMEDVILTGLEMLSMDADIDAAKTSGDSTPSSGESRKKSKSAPLDKKKASKMHVAKAKKMSLSSMKPSETSSMEPAVLKYIVDFGGCELCSLQKRSVIMISNSDKVYKFTWQEVDAVVVKPAVGYIAPGEEKDLELMFFSMQPVTFNKECLTCYLTPIRDDALASEKDTAWDSRQTKTAFDHNREIGLNERFEDVIEDQSVLSDEKPMRTLTIMIIYSAMTEYTKYKCTLPEKMPLKDTLIYKTQTFNFKIQNVGHVPMKVTWGFYIDEEYPAKIDKNVIKEVATAADETTNKPVGDLCESIAAPTETENKESKVTLFSGSMERQSVDTWFEMDLPFEIQPVRECLKPNETKSFTVTFAPLEAFDFNVRLKSSIDNLDPYDQNVSCKITAKSLIPYCHLDIEESDYLTSGRRTVVGMMIPPNTTVLEFNVLGSGCYKKTFNVVNPTCEGYEFTFESVIGENTELVPVHCNMLKGYVEGGTSTEVTFTFSPSTPGLFESPWKFIITVHKVMINILVVGIVREPDVVFVPTILVIKNSLVGFTTVNDVIMKNNETEDVKFEFKGNSLFNESGKTPVIVEPERGVLKPRSETPLQISYTPIQDGPLSFKIFCNVQYMNKTLTLCVNALSYSIKPKVTYFIIGNQHTLNSEAVTNIHLEQTASTYERIIKFVIKNDGSATFHFDWQFNCSGVKKYLNVTVEPASGHVPPGAELICQLHFHLKQVIVQAFPVCLAIADGPSYSILLHADIQKPMYHFSFKEYDFGKCFVNAPDTTYKKRITIVNDDEIPIIVDVDFGNLSEVFVFKRDPTPIEPKKQQKISVYFRPKAIKLYQFKLFFYINSLSEEIVTIKGEGIPLLFDLFEGCQKSFDLGPVKVGEKIVREIEVMNHSKIAIDATFIFRDMYPTIDDDANSVGTSICLDPPAVAPKVADPMSRVKMVQIFRNNKVREQIAMDIQNALKSLKVVPNKSTIQPYKKVPLKIQFKPIGLISNLNVQLNMKVLKFERPLVSLIGSATGMKLCFSQNSLQFGRVRKRGCKILKVMLHNKGDFGAKFWWQQLKSNEFTICPQNGFIAAHTDVTFTISFRPINHNPFVKIWASCNIENYKALELALYGTCVDVGQLQTKTVYFECPVREVVTEYISITNPTDEVWLILSEVSGGSYETLQEFQVEPNAAFDIPVLFKPKTMGKHEGQVLYSPLGETALFINLVGTAVNPNPNEVRYFTISAKEFHVENLPVFNLTQESESYSVSTELVKVIPDKFDSYYEIRYPEMVKTWGEAAATCRWIYVCYGECEMHLKVLFVNQKTQEFQFYYVIGMVTPGQVTDTVSMMCRARESTQTEVVVMNPLSIDAEFDIRCEGVTSPENLKVGRNSENTLTLTYSPLVVGEFEGRMRVHNDLIGEYVYKLMLKCLPAKVKELELATTLGSHVQTRLRVHNKTDYRADFISSVTHPCIHADPVYTLGPDAKGKFQISFEPTQLGIQKCQLSFDSPTAGEFVFMITGTATEPVPQGPFEIKPGSFTIISFTNVFENTRSFKIYVDRQEFYVKTTYETLAPRVELRLPVYAAESAAEGVAGCLYVETLEPPEPRVHWPYFLQVR